MVNHRSPKPELQVRFLPLLPKWLKQMANVIAKVPVFFREVKIELTKVSWPTKSELVGATWIVVIVTALLTTYIGILDFLLSKAVSVVLK